MRRLSPLSVAATAIVAAAATTTVIAGLVATASPAAAVRPGCTPSPARAPWLPGTAAGPAAAKPFLSAHRGGTTLAPQQTEQAHKSALAFGVDVTEIDIHVLADGGLAAFHDAATADGRSIGSLTTPQFKALNAATGSWKGTAFDPARYLLVDEVIAIAAGAGPGAGLDIEFKDLDLGSNGGTSPRLPYRAVAQKIKDAGLMPTSLWQYNQSQADLIADVKSVDPGARFNYNIAEPEPPADLYAQASTMDFSYGSGLSKFTPERLAAIHDGCAFAVPHSYDAGASGEFSQITSGRAAGVDGFQTNQPDVAADALDRPVASALRRDPADRGTVCLVNPANGYPLLGRTVLLDDGTASKVGPGGCLAAGSRLATFPGDGAALPSVEAAAPVVPEAPWPALLVAAGLAAAACVSRRRAGQPETGAMSASLAVPASAAARSLPS